MTKSKYQTIVLMGQAGTGKGTQAQKLSAALGFQVFSTGDKAREIAAQDTPLGRAVSAIHTQGWIPEWLASYFMVKTLIEEYPEEGVVFESVARKPEEAKKLHDIHQTLERPYIVIWLEAPEAVLTERLLARGRGEYDQPEKIAARRTAFAEETMQSISFFTENGTVEQVDATPSPEEVFAQIMTHVAR